MQDLTYKYHHKAATKTVYLVLHGGGPEGIETPFISAIIDKLTATGVSVFGFNFPYCERGDKNSSRPELTEETDALNTVVEFLRSEGFEKIVIVAKSLGGIISSFWLEKQPEADITVAVLGYVIGSVKTEALQGQLQLVIQGENDRFGSVQAVRDELAGHHVEAQVIAVPNADHSYRNEQKEPVFQDQAIELLLQNP